MDQQTMVAGSSNSRRRLASAVGVFLIVVGSIACLWRAANIVVMLVIGRTLPGRLVLEYVVTNAFDVLWCGLLAVVGYRIVKQVPGASRLLWVSTAMWAGGTAMYAMQAARATPGVSSVLRMTPVGILLGVLALRLVFWLPNITAHVLLRRQAARAELGQ